MRALWFDTPLGAMVAVGDAQTLGGLHFSGARHCPTSPAARTVETVSCFAGYNCR